MVFVGGGVIALEFGHVYARAGSKVTILEVLPQLLPAMDADAVEAVRKESERIGIAVHTGVKVKRVETAGNRLRTVFEQDGKERTVESDRVVNGAGRIANVETLDLDAGNVAHEGFKLAVDDYLRSKTNPSVYVCGDVDRLRRSSRPIATYEGRLVGRNIVEGAKHKPDYASHAVVGLHRAGARHRRPVRGQSQGAGAEDARAHQRHGRLVLDADFRRDRGLVENRSSRRIPTACSARISSAMPARS